MNILTLCNDDVCYNSLNYFRISLENAFTALGHTVYNARNFHEAMEYSKICDFNLGFNCNFLMEINDRNLYDLIGLPIVDFIVDNPYIHYTRLTYPLNEDLYVVCIDENHKAMLDKYYPAVKASVTGYLLTETSENLENITKERDILFLASYTDEMDKLNKLQTRPPLF